MASRPLNILVAPNGFKESLNAAQAARAIARGLRAVAPQNSIIELPLADGGSGTVAAIVEATEGKFMRASAHGPRGKIITARYGLLRDGQTAIIEMAAASGLTLLKPDERNPMLASSYGSGQLIRNALARGARRIIIGIGDSATVDGGIGALQALGARLLDARGRVVGEGGQALARIHSIDLSNVDKRLAETEILIASDVENRLLGARGAAAVFGPQKGATAAMVKKLDGGLAQWAKVLAQTTGKSVAELPGSGAAGGFACGFIAIWNARLISGSSLIFDYCDLKNRIAAADLIFTGEGSIDEQTLQGKMPAKLALAAKQAGKPLIALAAHIAISEKRLRKHGFYLAMPIVDRIISLSQAREQGAQLLAAAAARALQLIELGQEL
jgi:glycerate kinase